MAISYSISDTINYDTVGIGFTDPLTAFPAIYGNVNFEYTVTFTTTDVGKQITNVSVLSSPAYTNEIVLTANSVRIIKKLNEIIHPNEQYSFAEFAESDSDFSKNITVLQPNNTDQAILDSSVFRWDTPSQQVVTSSYSFGISSINTTIVTDIVTGVTETVTETQAETMTYTQDLVWSQTPGLVNLIDLVSKSKY